MPYASRKPFARAALRKIGLVSLCFALAATTMCVPLPFAVDSAEAAQGDVLVVAIDPGHGGGDPGASGNGVVEADANWDIAVACMDELNTYSGVKAVLTKDRNQNPSLRQRVQSGVDQGADVVVSIHCNSASASSANGSEVWVPNESAYNYSTHTEGKSLGSRILANLSGLGLYNRGVKVRDNTLGEVYPSPGGLTDYYSINYYARLHGIPGIIVEHAFVSNAGDAAMLASSAGRTSLGVADARGIAEYYGLTKDQGGSGSGGAGLEKTGEAVVTDIEAAYESDPAIMGTSRTTPESMAAWFKSKNVTFPSATYTRYGASTIEEFCRILYEEAAAEGVRAEVVFTQSMKETGWLRFGGQVKPEQCNFAGLGATDDGASGADFSSYGKDGVRTGLRAQIQHLKAYASTESLNGECVDPRFHLVTRGSAPNVKGLTGRWATSPTYGDDLTRMVNELLDTSGSAGQETAVKLSLADVPDSLTGKSEVTAYVDGVAQTMSVSDGFGTVMLSGSGTHTVTLYEYNADGVSDPHAVYPTHMYTWLVSASSTAYTAQRYYGFDDFLRYAGSSIRVTGTKGIRMITGVSSELKTALSGKGVLGCTLLETGTLIAWSDRVGEGGLTFETPGVSRGKAYVKGSQNPVFNTSDGVESYTNVLVGFSSADQYKRDMAMRSYAILVDASGNRFTVYGGTVERSILYIAEQNADAFAEGTAAYNFVHGIIDACKD